MNRLVTAALVAATAVGVTSAAPASSSSWPITPGTRQALMAAASANPDPGQTQNTDIQTVVDRARTRSVQVRAVAEASTTCDGCTGQAGVLQVVTAGAARQIDVDNAAVAWSTCPGCLSRSVAIQVVLARSARDVRAANRALAVNAGCTDCTTGAAAYQFVVVGGPDGLTRASRAMLEDLRQQLLALLGVTSPSPTARVTPNARPLAGEKLSSRLDDLAATARGDLSLNQGGASVTLHSDSDVH